MLKNRKHLFLSSAFAHYQPRKASAPDGGGGTPSGGDNNATGGGGNPGDSGTPAGTQNNTGGEFDAASFWDGPPADSSGAPSGESATGTTPQGGNPPANQGQQQPNFGDQLTQQLNGLQFGDPIFDSAIAEEINGGNFEGANKRIHAAMQAAVRNSLAMNVQILRPFAEQLMNQMREEMGSTLTSRDNVDTLVKDFPAAADPRVAPVIRSVFDQALKNTKGNRNEAVKQTKQMIALMANTTAGDLNLNVAPRGADDSGRPQDAVTNWLDELTSR